MKNPEIQRRYRGRKRIAAGYFALWSLTSPTVAPLIGPAAHFVDTELLGTLPAGAANCAVVPRGWTTQGAKIITVKIETLSGISRTSGVPVAVLAAANCLKSPDILIAGQKIVIPSRVVSKLAPSLVDPNCAPVEEGESYTILPGETLTEIAAQRGLDLGRLLIENCIVNPDKVNADTVIKIGTTTTLLDPTIVDSAPTVSANTSTSTTLTPAPKTTTTTTSLEENVIDLTGPKSDTTRISISSANNTFSPPVVPTDLPEYAGNIIDLTKKPPKKNRTLPLPEGSQTIAANYLGKTGNGETPDTRLIDELVEYEFDSSGKVKSVNIEKLVTYIEQNFDKVAGSPLDNPNDFPDSKGYYIMPDDPSQKGLDVRYKFYNGGVDGPSGNPVDHTERTSSATTIALALMLARHYEDVAKEFPTIGPIIVFSDFNSADHDDYGGHMTGIGFDTRMPRDGGDGNINVDAGIALMEPLFYARGKDNSKVVHDIVSSWRSIEEHYRMLGFSQDNRPGVFLDTEMGHLEHSHLMGMQKYALAKSFVKGHTAVGDPKNSQIAPSMNRTLPPPIGVPLGPNSRLFGNPAEPLSSVTVDVDGVSIVVNPGDKVDFTGGKISVVRGAAASLPPIERLKSGGIESYNLNADTVLSPTQIDTLMPYILTAICEPESNCIENPHSNTIGPNNAGASGTYQFILSTWKLYVNTYAKTLPEKEGAAFVAKYGGESYMANNAPREIQDKIAEHSVRSILAAHNNVLGSIAPMWYLGAFPEANDQKWDQVPKQELGNTKTPREYQSNWFKTFQKVLSNVQSKGPV